MKAFRDYILIVTAINLFIHLNFPGFAEWSANNRIEIANYVVSIFDSLSVYLA